MKKFGLFTSYSVGLSRPSRLLSNLHVLVYSLMLWKYEMCLVLWGSFEGFSLGWGPKSCLHRWNALRPWQHRNDIPCDVHVICYWPHPIVSRRVKQNYVWRLAHWFLERTPSKLEPDSSSVRCSVSSRTVTNDVRLTQPGEVVCRTHMCSKKKHIKRKDQDNDTVNSI